MSVRHIAVLVLVPLIGWPSTTHGAVTAWTAVVVRVYDANGVLAGTNRQALDEARKALEAASIEVVWRMCPASPSCDAPMAPGELAIRIVRAPVPLHQTATMSLGDALIDARTGAGVLATVYSDRIVRLAANAGVDCRALLGRAIAHELGHLLLATTTHGPVGLMRAYWSQDEVRRGQPRDWTFAPTELATMRRRAEALERTARLAWGTR
jgi:hypothetical protein